MIEVRTTKTFDEWLDRLKDRRARLIIADRLIRAAEGNLGDVKFFEGIGEMRIKFGPGYRLYFVKRGNTLIVLLCGGDKSTQKKDIKTALDMAEDG